MLLIGEIYVSQMQHGVRKGETPGAKVRAARQPTCRHVSKRDADFQMDVGHDSRQPADVMSDFTETIVNQSITSSSST
jgi:hypothetical protein